jgi:hypothetical protein
MAALRRKDLEELLNAANIGREFDVPVLAVSLFNPAQIDVVNDITQFGIDRHRPARLFHDDVFARPQTLTINRQSCRGGFSNPLSTGNRSADGNSPVLSHQWQTEAICPNRHAASAGPGRV